MWRSRALEAAVMVATPVPVEMPLAVALASAYRFNEAPRCERIARIANDVAEAVGGESGDDLRLGLELVEQPAGLVRDASTDPARGRTIRGHPRAAGRALFGGAVSRGGWGRLL
jgi:hypothetical protein